MKRDKIIFSLIDEEQERQETGLELIASENFVSRQVMEAAGSVLTNKYAEGLPGKRYYGGCEHVDIVEDIARSRAWRIGTTGPGSRPVSACRHSSAGVTMMFGPSAVRHSTRQYPHERPHLPRRP